MFLGARRAVGVCEPVFGLLHRDKIDLAWVVENDADVCARHQEGATDKGLSDQTDSADPLSHPVPAERDRKIADIGPDRQTNNVSPVPAKIHLQTRPAMPPPALDDTTLNGGDAADEFHSV